MKRDWSNPHDRNAIAVCAASGEMLGHISKLDALQLADALDRGATCGAEVLSKVENPARICIRVSVDESSATSRLARVGDSNTTRQTPQETGRLGCVAILTLAVVLWLLDR